MIECAKFAFVVGGFALVESILAFKNKLTWNMAARNILAVSAAYIIINFVCHHCK